MSKFFINRPVFAWVISLFIILAGLVSLISLPVEQYPSVGSPTIQLTTIYPGASAKTHEEAVLSVIEREMNGLEGLDYMQATANANGIGSLSLTFRTGIDEDIAQVHVQNRLSRAEPKLPEAVRKNGVAISRAGNNYLMIVTLQAEEGANINLRELNDYAVRNIIPEIQRIKGVGGVQQFGSETAMRVWIDPEKLRGYGLTAANVNQAIASQNLQMVAGSIGALPAQEGQSIFAQINVQGQLDDVEQFKNIILKSNESGSTVRMKDVATVELGEQDYNTVLRLNGHPATGVGIKLSTTGNAVETAAAVYARMEELGTYLPEGVKWEIPYDTSRFVKISIEKVLHTLMEAMVLVFLVMFLFLQNMRYTLIPTIVVPVSLLGAIALMTPLGMSINVLTMFAMVLVIGIVVDDAIVVVENVERLMAEEGLTPYQATLKSMGQISGAILGITIVNIVVFLPMSFFSGATGNIYRQFALVMAGSIGFSGFLALTLTPALCATMLKPIEKGSHHEKRGFFGWFNRFMKRRRDAYGRKVGKTIRVSYFMLLIYAAITATAIFLYQRVPTGFLPQEDQGYLIANVQLPSGATLERTTETVKEMEKQVLANEDVDSMATVQGFSFTGQGQNMGLAFITLKDWDNRPGIPHSAGILSLKFMFDFFKISDASIFALSPPPIPELGSSTGFSLMLEDRAGAGHLELTKARDQLLALASKYPTKLTGLRPGGLPDAAQLQIEIDRDAAYAQGVSMNNIAAVLGISMASSYVGDFPNNGRLQRVIVQSEPAARMQPEEVMALSVPNNTGKLVPLSTIASISWVDGPMQLVRYNGYPAMAISGQAAPGFSSGEAMELMSSLAKELPKGFGIEWTGLSLEEQRAGNQSLYVYLFTVIGIFLCLAALYESWSIPFAVLMVLPLGFFGIVCGVTGRNMFVNYIAAKFAIPPFEIFARDVYFQIGMITVMGLSAKNAILIIEFAKDLQAEGMQRVQAALTAAKLRFRPIIMTSLAFILGVVPLYFASGASSASQRAIGTSVFWGMLVGTIFSLYLVPIFFVIVRKLFPARLGGHDKYAPAAIEHKEMP